MLNPCDHESVAVDQSYTFSRIIHSISLSVRRKKHCELVDAFVAKQPPTMSLHHQSRSQQSVLHLFMRHPLDIPVRKPEASQDNIDAHLRIHMISHMLLQLLGQALKPSPQPRRQIGEGTKKEIPRRQPVQHRSPHMTRQIARRGSRGGGVGHGAQTGVEVFAGADEQAVQARSRERVGEAVESEEMPERGDEGGVVWEVEVVEDVQEGFGGELVDGELVQGDEGDGG